MRDPTDFVMALKKALEQMKNPGNLFTCDRILLRVDHIKKPFASLYEGPFDVIKRLRKTVIIKKGQKEITISWDRVKPFKSAIKNNEHEEPQKKVTFLTKKGE